MAHCFSIEHSHLHIGNIKMLSTAFYERIIGAIGEENLRGLTANQESDLIKKYETNFKGVGQPLRVALTGSKFGPGLYDIVISLGKEEVERRLGNKIIT